MNGRVTWCIRDTYGCGSTWKYDIFASVNEERAMVYCLEKAGGERKQGIAHKFVPVSARCGASSLVFLFVPQVVLGILLWG